MNRILYKNSCKINNNEVLKPKKLDIEKVYNYLENRKFQHFIKPIEVTIYEKYPYIEDYEIDISTRCTDIIYLMSILHTKTTTFNNNNQVLKIIYEKTIKKINETKMYYLKKQDEIEEKIYMTPGEQELIYNISKIYESLNYSYKYINEFYNDMKNYENVRMCYIHGNLKPEHIIENEEKYLISWNKSRKDLPIYDLLYFFRNVEFDINKNTLFEIYESKYKMRNYEKYLLFALLLIPECIIFCNNEYENSLIAYNLTNQVKEGIKFVLEEDKKQQESNNYKFN